MQVLKVATVIRTSWNFSTGNGLTEGLSPDQQQQEHSSDETELKEEIEDVICEALMLVNQTHGSYNDFEDVLTFAKEFFRND